jgi:class 3 adenylate cyclase
VQGLAMSQSILATAPVVQNPRSASVLGSNGHKPVAQSRALRGISSEVAIYEIA